VFVVCPERESELVCQLLGGGLGAAQKVPILAVQSAA